MENNISMQSLGYYTGELSTASYMISRGVKPVYSICIPKKYFKYLIGGLQDCLEGYDLYYTDRFYRVQDEDYVDVSLFKYPYLERILRFSNFLSGRKTSDILNQDLKTEDLKDGAAFREWVFGKIYGFGDREIGEHIEKIFNITYKERTNGSTLDTTIQ